MNRGQLTDLKQELCIKDNGKEALETEKVNNYGLMVLNTLEYGEKTELMVKANLFM